MSQQKTPITIEIISEVKVKLNLLAISLGLIRTVKGAEVGNITGVLNLFIVFVYEHRDQFVEWYSKRVSEALAK